MNGSQQSYLSQGDSLSPTNSTSMHMGSQSMRSHIDQYQPQGNFQPPGMAYNSNAPYGPYPTPQPHLPHMYDGRLSTVAMETDMEDLNSAHRMTNSRLKTLIHNRQSQREQLVPISNDYNSSPSPIGRQDSSAYSSSLSPVSRYASPYSHPPDAMMQYGGQSDGQSSLMHLQRLSPNSISPQKVQRPSWSSESRKTPESLMVAKSPVAAAKPAQNGHGQLQVEPVAETKMVNGHDKPTDINGGLDKSSDIVNANGHNGVAKDPVESSAKLERKTPVPEVKIPPTNERILPPPSVPQSPNGAQRPQQTPSDRPPLPSPIERVMQTPNDRALQPQQSPNDRVLHPLQTQNDRVLQPLHTQNDRVLQPLHAQNDRVLQQLQAPNDRVLQPLHTQNDRVLHPLHIQNDRVLQPLQSRNERVLHPLQIPAGSPRYPTNHSGLMTPPYAYRHYPPNPAGCMPPPASIPVNGVHPPETNCDDPPTQSSPFLLNTTTSMSTYTSITNTYNSSKLSFSNATCLPTFALTSVSPSSQMYCGSRGFAVESSSLPPGGGKSRVDSGRIHHGSPLEPPSPFRQDLPLLTTPSHYPYPYPPSCYPYPDHQQQPPPPATPEEPDRETEDRIEKLRTNTKLDPPQCDCLKNKEVMPSEKLPYYTHLGSGSSVSAIRELMECRSGEKGNAIRIEKLLYSGKEGKTSQGCPLAKWIIRRSGPEEKLLTVVRHRPGHTCPNAYIVIAMVAWEGVQEAVADVLYRTVTYKAVNFGIPTQRKCGTNEMRTCACQGLDLETCGASFSFGCSWSMYYNGCKFARSKNARKFKLTEKDEEKELEDRLQTLASDVSHLYKKMAPESFYNQTEFEQQASECRLGVRKGRPFSGVTACLDYCAHSHKDLQNMNNGCTVVVTLTKHKGWEKPEDEQLHVLPLYVMDSTDEFGSKEGQEKKINAGAVEVLDKFPIDYRIRTTPLKPCKTRGRKPKDGFSPRKQALQAAFRQLIASGKLRRIDPPDPYSNNRMMQQQQNLQLQNQNSVQPDSSVDSPFQDSCKFYAGKHVSHNSYMARSQGWGGPHQNFNQNNNNPTSSVVNEPPCSSYPATFSNSSTNTCSKMTLTSSCSSYNDSNNNYMPCASYPMPQAPSPQSYRPHHATQSTYSHYNPGTNPLPPSFGSQTNNVHVSGHPYHGSYAHNNGPHFENNNNNNAFQGQYGYGYSPPNVPLKIPGNYSASSYPSPQQQQSTNMNCQSAPYADSHPTLNSNFCNYTMQRPHAPASFSTPEPQNNFQGFYPEQQNVHFPSPNSNASRVSTPHFQNSPCSGNQSVYVKSENATEPFPEKVTPENPDSVYTMTDLDSKSVNCFSTSKQPTPPSSTEKEHPIVKKEESKYYETPKTTIPPYRCDNYYPSAKNYNYHLQQSNMILDFDNFNDNEYGTYKEGYEKCVYDSRDPVPNNNNNNKDLASMTKMTEAPYPFQKDHLQVLASKYSMEEEESFIDSTTLEGDEVYEGHSDNESSFKDVEVGGVAIALTHGSVLFECAKHELHATTAVKRPNRRNPTRISLVFYQHKHLNFESHGEAEWGQKMKEKRVGAKVCFEEAPKRQCFGGEEPGTVATGFPGTTPTTSWVTVFSIAPLSVGAPFRP